MTHPPDPSDSPNPSAPSPLPPAPVIPIFLKAEPARPCLVVGGGAVAERKVRWLAGCGARVEVITLEATGPLEELARQCEPQVWLSREPYRSRDLSPYLLVIAATNQPELNRQVAEDARRAGVPINVVDEPALCSFYVPALARRGALQLAVSTGGACPALAARIRAELEEAYPPWHEPLTAALGQVRRELLATCPDPARRKQALEALASRAVAERLQGLDEESMARELAAEAEKLLY